MKQLGSVLKRVPRTLLALVLLLLLFTAIKPAFLSGYNIMNILRAGSILLVAATGMTIVIISGQIDISIGGIITLCSVLTAMFLKQYEDPTALQIMLAFVLSAGIGAVCGAFEGLLTGVFQFNYWLVTFANMSITYGLAKAVTDGGIISDFSKSFRWVSTGKVAGFSMCIIFAAIFCLLMILFFNHSRFGLHIYAIGNSEPAAANAGIRVKWNRLAAYALCGLMSGIAAVLLTARTNSSGATIGEGYEFMAIAAVVIGGTPMDGGKGGLTGTILGTFFIAALKNGLQVIGLDNFWQQFCLGVIIVAIIIYDVVSNTARVKTDMRRTYHD